MSSDESNTVCWVISDGAAGNERQALALAKALGLTPHVLRLRLARPWDWFAPRLSFCAQRGMFTEDGRPIEAPWPDFAIGCGRKAALLTRCLRYWSRGQCFTVQILDPRVAPRLFDAVVAPRHDCLVGANVIETLGALNAIDDVWLADARARFAHFAALPAPRTAVLIGATHRAQALDDRYFAALHHALSDRHARFGGSFLVSTSRRTPKSLIAGLRGFFSSWPGIFWADEADGENPYAGILAWADRIVVSADSVNMISEACATGKPVHAFAPQPIGGKLGKFHQALAHAGYLLPMDGNSPSAHLPLRELTQVAEKIQSLWRMRRKAILS